MRISRIKQLARIGWDFNNYIRAPMTLEQAVDGIKKRLDNRESNFLTFADKLIYGNKYSPYRKLLFRAGCEYKDLEQSVRNQGLEKTLEKLRDEGVYVTLEEFKSKAPICRNGLTFETRQTDFDNPYLMGKSIQGATSGSRSKGTRVMYDLDFITEEAANELTLFENHGLSNSQLAFWLPSLPSISGIINLLISIKLRRPPTKWFSHLDSRIVNQSLKNRLAIEYIVWCCRVYGLSIPRPEFTDIRSAAKVADWIAKNKDNKSKKVVMTYASSAVRIVKAAMDKGIDISGSVIFTGGEPLTEKRCNYIESASVNAFPRYASAEAGLIGASCEQRNSPDDMHIYTDRLTIIQRNRKTIIEGYEVNSFLFTSLSSNVGKVLLNTEIGDFGNLSVKQCSCLFGKLGMNLRVSEVRSHDKLTGEGMTLLGSELYDIVGKMIANAGGGPDDYQFWESHDNKGLSKLVIAISPEIHNLNENDFVVAILERLKSKDTGSHIASQIWKQADTLRVVRAHPKLTKGYKMLPFIKET
jgi:hypothetical protein